MPKDVMNHFNEDSPLRRLLQERANAYQPPSTPSDNPFSRFPSPQPAPRKIRILKPKVFVSFDYENDRLYKQALNMWDANKRFEFTFHDKTPQEIQSYDVGRIKAVLTTKVQEAKVAMVLVGRHANQPHRDHTKIGCLNWIHFEMQQAIAYKKKLVAVLLEPTNALPTIIEGQPGILVNGFKQAEIIKALFDV